MNRLLKFIIPGVVLIAIATAVSVFVITPSAALDQATVSTGTTTPSIVWNAPSISETIKPGESKQAQVVLTAQSAIPAGTLRIVPELQPFLSVTPSTIPALAKGQTLPVTLTFSAKIDALPATTTGTIQLRDNADGVTVSKPLPVTLNVVWAQATGLPTGISFMYPTFGQLSKTVEQMDSDGTVRVSILDNDVAPPLLQYIIRFTPNPTHLPLLKWFAQQVDLSGSILAGGGYQISTLPNGVQALVITGELPAAHLDCCGPVEDVYAISPSGATIMTVSTGEEHSFGAIGDSPDSLLRLYLAMLASVTAP